MYRSLPGAVPPLGGQRGKPWSGPNMGPMKPQAPSPFHMSGGFSPVPQKPAGPMSGGSPMGGGQDAALELARQRAQQMGGGAAPMQMQPSSMPQGSPSYRAPVMGGTRLPRPTQFAPDGAHAPFDRVFGRGPQPSGGPPQSLPSSRNVYNAAQFMQKLAMQKRDLAARGRFVG
jgi:hypothetical protein